MLRKFEYPWLLLKRSLWLLLPIAGIGMAESRLGNQRCNNIVIHVDDDSGMRFLDKTDIQLLLTENGGDPLLGSRLRDVHLSDLENRVRKNRLVKKCQVFRDLKGNIVVEVEQEKPLARWINTSKNGEWRNTSGYYINEEGTFFPLSESYSARTLLVSGPFFTDSKKLKTKKGVLLMDLIRYLNTNEFWKAQVAEMNVDNDGEVQLTTMLGDQRIELGMAEDFESKFSKLRIFYDKVLSKDWSRYSRISVKFQDQIVCE